MEPNQKKISLGIKELQEIDGLGPKAATALVASGLRTKRALAESTPADVAARLKRHDVRISATRIEQDDWLGQAQDQIAGTHLLEHLEFQVEFERIRQGGVAKWLTRVQQMPGDEAELDGVAVGAWARWIVDHAGIDPLTESFDITGDSHAENVLFREPSLSQSGCLSVPVEVRPPQLGEWTLIVDMRNAVTHRAHGTYRWQGRFEVKEPTTVDFRSPLPPLGQYEIDAMLLVDGAAETSQHLGHLELELKPEERDERSLVPG